MAAGEQLALFIPYRVDAVHHRLVGREHAVRRIVVFLLAEVRHREIWQEIHKVPLRLGHQGIPVCQKQNIFDPSLVQQHFNQRNDRPGLARSGRHDQ